MGKTIQLIIVGLLLAFSACTDERQAISAALRLRLKTTVKDDNTRTEYVYNEKNLQASVSRFYQATITYDDQNQYQRIEQVSGNSLFRTYFTYQPSPQGGKLVTAKTYAVTPASGQESLNNTSTYTFDANNHLLTSSFLLVNSSISQTATYSYTGDNITRVESRPGGGVLTVYTYEYDDKINPFYGLITPESMTSPTDIGINTYSRNNVLKRSINGIPNYMNFYQYNAQGLPVSVNMPFNDNRFSLIYESF